MYRKEIDSLKGLSIDTAFLPVDGRLEDKYLWGLDYFMRNVGAKHVFPMHFWGNFHLCEDIKKADLTIPYQDKLMVLHHKNEKFVIYDENIKN